MQTGYLELDRLTKGLSPGDLILLSGETAVGKTAFALNIALHEARHGGAVAIFSLETTKERLSERLISTATSVPYRDIATRNLTSGEWSGLVRGTIGLLRAHLYLDDSIHVEINDMRERARRTSIERLRTGLNPLSLIVVDYLQLLPPRGYGVGDRRRTVAANLRGLKRLAENLGVPVLVISQLDRDSDRHLRPDKRPSLADLGELEHFPNYADTVIFLYRDECYNPDSDDKGIAEVIVARQQLGPVGRVRLAWMPDTGRYASLVR